MGLVYNAITSEIAPVNSLNKRSHSDHTELSGSTESCLMTPNVSIHMTSVTSLWELPSKFKEVTVQIGTTWIPRLLHDIPPP